jgi:hypothetical protein
MRQVLANDVAELSLCNSLDVDEVKLLCDALRKNASVTNISLACECFFLGFLCCVWGSINPLLQIGDLFFDESRILEFARALEENTSVVSFAICCESRSFCFE